MGIRCFSAMKPATNPARSGSDLNPLPLTTSLVTNTFGVSGVLYARDKTTAKRLTHSSLRGEVDRAFSDIAEIFAPECVSGQLHELCVSGQLHELCVSGQLHELCVSGQLHELQGEPRKVANPKSEFRTPKQAGNSNQDKNTGPAMIRLFLNFEPSNLFRISCFAFRIFQQRVLSSNTARTLA